MCALLADQVASLGAERESLARQNAALAAALGDRLAGAAAAAEAAADADTTPQQQQQGQQQQQQQQQAVSPAKLRELGAMLQRLTQENAALIKAR
jgi:transcription initiation factor TFIID subunit TAF12